MYCRARTRQISIVIGVFAMALALAMMMAVPATAGVNPYPDPPPDFPVIGDDHAHGDLLSPLGGQTSRHVLVLYNEYPGLPFEMADVPPDSRFDGLAYMNAWGVHEQFFGGFPSARGYFEEVSDGRLLLDPVPVEDGANDSGVDGVVQISVDKDREEDFTGSPAAEMEFLLEEASEYVDFSQFANDDGVITELELSIVRHDTDDRKVPEGGGLVRNGPSTSFKVDGVTFQNFSSGRYRHVITRTATNLMTIVHEFGHQLFDMPDSYHQDPDREGLIGSQTDLGGRTVGTAYDDLWRPNAWHYMHLGWAEPTVVTQSGYYDVPREPAGSSFILYDPDRGTDDYFIVENRAPIPGTYDQGVGSTGLMIWRVDESEYTVLGFTGWLELVHRAAINPPLTHDHPARTVDDLTWRDGTATDLAVRAISPADDVMRVYFDVRGPGVLVDPVRPPVIHNVTPGVEAELPVTVMNTGEETDTFEVFLEGPADWDSVAYEIELEAGQEAEALPAIIPATDTPVDTFELSVTARSTTDASVSEQAPLVVVVVLDATNVEYTGETYVPMDEPAGFEAVVTNVDDNDAPVEGVEVTFELSGVGGELTATATTGANGVAEANPIIDLPPGDYFVTASTERFGRHAAATSNLVEFRVPTAAERIEDLQEDIIAEGLHHGTQTSLLAILDASLDQLDEDDTKGACNTLAAFINRVNAQHGKHIPSDAADGFLSDAEAIRVQLECD